MSNLVEQNKELARRFQTLFGTDLGREVLKDIKDIARLDKPSFTADSNGNYDPLKAALNDGGKRLACIILELSTKKE